MGAGTRTRVNVERETPTPCGKRNRRQSQRTTHQFYPKPRTHTKQATAPISNRTRNAQTLTANAVSHLLFPTSFLHVFAFSSSLGLNILLNAFPLSSSTTPPALLLSHFYLLRFPFIAKNHLDPLLLKSVPFLPFLAVSSMVFSTCFHAFSSSRLFFTLSLSFSFLPLASPSFFFRTSLARSRWLQRFAPQAVVPAPCRPTSTRTSTSLRASCQAARGSTPLACCWGALPKRRGNAGSDSELPYHLNTFFEARWVCVFASSLSLALTLALALTLTLTLTFTLTLTLTLTLSPTVPPRARTRISCPLTSLTLSLLLLPPLLLLRLRLLLLFVLSSSSLYFLPSSSSSSPLLLLLSRRLLLLCFRLC